MFPPPTTDSFIFVPCNCEVDQSIGGKRTKTEYYSSTEEAAKAIARHVIDEHTYWCVHLNGQHTVAVNINNKWYGGFDADGKWADGRIK